MANAHAHHTIRTVPTYRPERPKFSVAEMVNGLLHESARRMMAAQIDDDDETSLEMRIHEHQKAMLLLAAAERIGDLELEG
jgi:hypothetical protein